MTEKVETFFFKQIATSWLGHSQFVHVSVPLSRGLVAVVNFTRELGKIETASSKKS